MITFPELSDNIQVWLYNIQDGYITHPNLPDAMSHSHIVLVCDTSHGLLSYNGSVMMRYSLDIMITYTGNLNIITTQRDV